MKLYTFLPSPNSLRVCAVANQMGIELEIVPVDLSKGEHLESEFLALNPNHKIPTLVDGDFVLWESTAIMLYLAYQSGRLIPKEPRERARMHQWISWNNAHMGPACGMLLFENLVKKLLNLGQPDPEQIKKGNQEFARYAQVLNDYLKGRGQLVGNTVTVADHHVVASFVHAESAAMPVDAYPELQRWCGEMLATPPWQSALSALKA